jgi:hypothetical protein
MPSSYPMRNPICTVLFICIIFVLFVSIIVLILNRIFDIHLLEGFYAKRNERIRIYKSDEIFDPDETPEIEDIDPDDDPMNFDPDQAQLLDRHKIYQHSNNNVKK